MRIFISWSGAASREFAQILKEWLTTVLPYARPWLSSDDIRKGKPWDSELTNQLEATSYSLVCVTTRQVAEAPWVNFEAGAVSKYIDHAHVSPLLVGISPEDLEGVPLARFQCTQFNEADVRRLLHSINKESESSISEEQLSRNLRHTWSQFKESVAKLRLSDDSTSPSAEDDDRNDRRAAIEGAYRQSAQTDHHAIVASIPVGEELAQYEITGLVVVTEEVGAKIDIYEFYPKMERAGIKKLEATLAQKALVSRGMLEAFQDETYAGEPYDALQVTPKGIGWLLENDDQLNRRSGAPLPPTVEPDDDLPF